MNKKGGTVCSAPGCASRTSQRTMIKDLRFFRFPKDPEWSKVWLNACNRRDLLDKPSTALYKNYRLCSLHFEEKTYANDLRNRLLPTATPTIFPYIKSLKRKNTKKKMCGELAGKINSLSTATFSNNSSPRDKEIMHSEIVESDSEYEQYNSDDDIEESGST